MDQIETIYNSGATAKRDGIRKKAVELGLTAATVPDAAFVKTLRRAMDGNSDTVTQKFNVLEEFSAQAQ
jgi:hypothetical protein